MNVNSLKNHKCPGVVGSLKERNPRYELMGKGAEAVCASLAKGSTLEKALAEGKETMNGLYRTEESFDFGWQKELYLTNDFLAVKRAFDYIFAEAEFVEAGVWCEVSTTLYDGKITGKVDLVMKRANGRYCAVNLHCGKNNDRSDRGKGVTTLTWYNPSAVLAKHCLEGKYPGIIVWDVYLIGSDDTDEAVCKTFDDAPKKGGQLLVSAYENLKECQGEDRKFSMEKFLELEAKAFEQPGEPPCAICEMAHLCNNGFPRLEPRYEYAEEEKEEEAYTLPEFSGEQKEVIEHGDGAMIVVAGPGSGKTATLVGRINYLVSQRHVDPEFILAITFTKKAAGEISRRCSALLEGGSDVKVSTLNALGYEILKDNAEKLGLDVSRLLTDDVIKTFISDLLSDFGRLSGIKYTLKKGVNGYLSVIKKHIEKYDRCADDEERQKYLDANKLGMDFVEFYKRYTESIHAGGFITYDEQVSLCVKALRENEELREVYSSLYWYVCVDEYQDINEMQFEFIRLLAGRGNLMAIGDDDQAIFGFNGGSAEYMLRFTEFYPEADKYLLTMNFRSSANIVTMAAANAYDGEDREKKEIKAVKGPGAEVTVSVSEDYPTDAGAIVRELLEKGCKPEDMAVLSYKNSTLEGITAASADIPFKVEGEKLCRNAFFTLLRTVLRLKKEPENDRARLEYFALFGLPKPSYDEYAEKLKDADASAPYVEMGSEPCAYGVLKALSGSFKFREFFERAAFISGYINQKVYPQVLDEMKNRGVRDLDAFLETAEAMVFAEDITEASVDYPGRVVCTTVHKAKGREWKYVIVADDFGTRESADTRRVIYTAITRAIDGLYILKSPKSLLRA